MAIRFRHQAGGALIGAYAAGQAEGTRRRQKYAMDLYRDRQNLMGRMYLQDRDWKRRMLMREEDRKHARGMLEDRLAADKEMFKEREARRAREHEDLRVRDEDRRDLGRADELVRGNFGIDERDIEEGRYSADDAKALRKLNEDARRVLASKRFTDPIDREEWLKEYNAQRDAILKNRTEPPTPEERARERVLLFDEDLKDFVPRDKAGENVVVVPLDKDGNPDMKNAYDPRARAADAAANLEEERKEKQAKAMEQRQALEDDLFKLQEQEDTLRREIGDNDDATPNADQERQLKTINERRRQLQGRMDATGVAPQRAEGIFAPQPGAVPEDVAKGLYDEGWSKETYIWARRVQQYDKMGVHVDEEQLQLAKEVLRAAAGGGR